MLDSADRNHASALVAAMELARLGCRLFQTTWLRAETHALLLVRLGHQPARQWLSAPSPAPLRPEHSDEVQPEEIVKRFKDKGYSLCDALSFAVIKRLRAAGAFTFDRHFRQHRVPTVPEM